MFEKFVADKDVFVWLPIGLSLSATYYYLR